MTDKTDKLMPQNWPAMTPQLVDISKLTNYPRNSRKHSADQVAEIAKSIQTFGFTFPVLQDEAGTIIAGHGRIMAAKKLGLKQVPVITATGWSEAQKRAYVIADNKLTDNSTWDKKILAEELKEIADLGFDVTITGFDQDEIDKLEKLFQGDGADPSSQLGEMEYQIVVKCRDEMHQTELLDRFEKDGLEVKAMMS